MVKVGLLQVFSASFLKGAGTGVAQYLCDTRTKAGTCSDTRTEAVLAGMVGAGLSMQGMGTVHPEYFDRGKIFLIRTTQ